MLWRRSVQFSLGRESSLVEPGREGVADDNPFPRRGRFCFRLYVVEDIRQGMQVGQWLFPFRKSCHEGVSMAIHQSRQYRLAFGIDNASRFSLVFESLS